MSIVFASIYGVLHDQFTYSVSHEYYNRFKFDQFGLGYDPTRDSVDPRAIVVLVGVMATWWFGALMGIVLAVVGLAHKSAMQMFKLSLRALMVILCIAILFGFVGLGLGYYHLYMRDLLWYIPEGLVDRRAFVAVGSMHNFSYLGGLVGLLAGVVYSVIQIRRNR